MSDDYAAQVRRQRVILFQKLIARFGPEVLDIVAEHSREQTRLELENENIPERNLAAVKSLLWDQLPPEFEYTVEENTSQRLRFKVTHCPMADEMRAYSAGEIGYAQHCATDPGFCAGLNPEIQFSCTKTLMRGDDCCNHTYELKQS